MMRPIDADALACAKLDFSKIYIAGRRSRKGLELARFCAKVVLREMIASAPTIEAEPVRHGRWVEDADEEMVCTECGTRIPEMYSNADSILPCECKFCHYCGAKMDLEGE